MHIQDSIAIVTGGASGLGEATVKQIVSKGGKAILLDLQENRAKQVIEHCENNALFIKTDVTNIEMVKAAIDQAITKFGSINTVVNCAGIAIAKKVLSSKGTHELEAFSKVISINLIGTFNVIRLAAEKMALNQPNEFGERGVIINTASVAAFEGQIGQAAYSASKGGVAAMTLPIAREFATKGIRVMAIAPGLFHTPMVDSLPEEAMQALGRSVPFPNRLGKPAEYAQLVESIISNPMLNGETIRLDGAIRMQPK